MLIALLVLFLKWSFCRFWAAPMEKAACLQASSAFKPRHSPGPSCRPFSSRLVCPKEDRLGVLLPCLPLPDLSCYLPSTSPVLTFLVLRLPSLAAHVSLSLLTQFVLLLGLGSSWGPDFWYHSSDFNMEWSHCHSPVLVSISGHFLPIKGGYWICPLYS